MSASTRSPAPSPLVLAAAADGAYAAPLTVMLRSVAEHLAPDRSFEAYVVDDGLTERDRRRVETSLPPCGAVRWVAPATSVASLPLWGRMPSTTYQKIALGDWLPRATTRAIWLDCDTLVRADLALLWETEMGEHTVLAAQDTLVPRLASRFGVAGYRELALPPDGGYLNAGVLLVDLDRWRRSGVARRAMDYLERFGDRVYFWDQEALNAALAGRWGRLDDRWNRNPTLARLLRRSGSEDPETWIAHYSGRLKPWRFADACPYADEFQALLDATAWAGWRPAASWQSWLIAQYAVSPLRRRLFPLEQLWTAALRFATRRRRPNVRGRRTTAPAAP